MNNDKTQSKSNKNIKETFNSIVKGAGTAVSTVADKTKGTIYPIVKSVSKWFGVNMTKQIFAGFFKKAIPVVGGVIGGGITYFSFKPCCDKLKESLQDTLLSNPNHHILEDELIISDTIEVPKNNEIRSY